MDTTSPSAEKLQVRCCIAGGGPAGIMLGFLLARAGVDVVVLEKHADFLRDFRGDTIHPSTLEVMYELGLLEELLKRPYQQLPQLRAQMGSGEVVIADFSPPLSCIPLRMQAEVAGLIEDGGRIVGVRAKTPNGELEVRAELVVGADGRNSIVRGASGLTVEDIGAPMDALWMRLPRRLGDPPTTLRFDRGKILVMIDRGDCWQIAFVIRKGGLEEIQRKGIDDLRAALWKLRLFCGTASTSSTIGATSSC